MKKLTRVFSIGVFSLAVAAAPLVALFSAPKAEARTYRNQSFYDQTNRTYFRHTMTDFHDMRYMRTFYPTARITADRNFFMNQNLFSRYPFMNRFFPNEMFSRRVIVIDRDFPTSRIVVTNQNTGPFSVNETRISVNHDIFGRLSNAFDENNNISVRVDTGSNTVDFNTIVGDVSTGDVNISIR